MAVKRLATDFGGSTNPSDNLGDPAQILDGRTGVMFPILRSGGGLSGQAGDVRAYVGDPESTVGYRSRNSGLDLVAKARGAEIWFRPREGTPSDTGGDMPGLRVTMLWQSTPTRNATIAINLTGDLAPGPMVEANVETSYNNGDISEFDSIDLTAHDWFAWHRLTWYPTGAWEVATTGGVIASGTLEPIPSDYANPSGDGLAVNVAADLYYTGGGGPGTFNGAGALVDDLSVWIQGGPSTRRYPREDGRGMSSAPRIHPAPKSQRVIGGHQ